MKVCPKCGFRDNPLWRHSRFDYNADYMRWEDFQTEFPEVAKLLEGQKNHVPIPLLGYVFYRRGTGGLQVYRVATEDYKMPRERKDHRKEAKPKKIDVVEEMDKIERRESKQVELASEGETK